MIYRQILSKYGFKAFMLICCLYINNANADLNCSYSLANAYGPYDYTNPEHFSARLPIVNSHHYTQEIIRSAQRISDRPLPPLDIVDNLDYTLRAFPNHHQALNSIADYLLYLSKNDNNRYRELTKRFRKPECYFERAIRFKPSDATVHLIYGVFLVKKKNLKRALEEMETALKLRKDNPEVLYNIGLIYYKQNNLEKAAEYAKRAYNLGFLLPFLRDELKRRGKW